MTERAALVKNAGDPEQVKEARSREKFGRDRELDDVRQVMSTRPGRRLVWRLMKRANPGVEFSPDPHWQYFTLGNANVATWLEAEIEAACPELYDKMRQEARNGQD